MQAISEGETENSDGSPHDDRSSWKMHLRIWASTKSRHSLWHL